MYKLRRLPVSKKGRAEKYMRVVKYTNCHDLPGPQDTHFMADCCSHEHDGEPAQTQSGRETKGGLYSVHQNTENLEGQWQAFWLGRANLGDIAGEATKVEISFSSLGFYQGDWGCVLKLTGNGLKQGQEMLSKLYIRIITSYPICGRHWW